MHLNPYPQFPDLRNQDQIKADLLHAKDTRKVLQFEQMFGQHCSI